MDMPGSKTAPEELPCRVLSHLLEQGLIAKIADDLYCGGNSPHELLQKSVTGATQVQSPFFSVEDHYQSPVHNGTWMGLELLKASPHRVAALAVCP